ncbi:MAG: OsmC family peroxiredoxin [Anaerolineae bacterium]
MAIRKAEAVWKGTLKEGSGTFKGDSGALNGGYSFKTRFEEDKSMTNPEELVGAAHAGCYAMFLSAQLTAAGFTPNTITATDELDFGRDDKGPLIQSITLHVVANVPGVSQAQFDELAQKSKNSAHFPRPCRHSNYTGC